MKKAHYLRLTGKGLALLMLVPFVTFTQGSVSTGGNVSLISSSPGDGGGGTTSGGNISAIVSTGFSVGGGVSGGGNISLASGFVGQANRFAGGPVDIAGNRANAALRASRLNQLRKLKIKLKKAKKRGDTRKVIIITKQIKRLKRLL